MAKVMISFAGSPDRLIRLCGSLGKIKKVSGLIILKRKKGGKRPKTSKIIALLKVQMGVSEVKRIKKRKR
jgi:hypothetical protein